MANTRKPLEGRLLSKVAINASSGCWEWTGSKDTKGYGCVKYYGSTRRAHRASYELHCGGIPKGMHVCHRCDNRSCVNPEHLFLGTIAENIADRDAKGRQAKLKGERNGQAKLNEHDVIAIRSAKGFFQHELARQFGVSQTLIWRIRAGKCWRHV